MATVWALHFLFCYVFAAVICAKSGPLQSLDQVRLAITAATIVALLIVQCAATAVLWLLRAYPFVVTMGQFMTIVLLTLFGTIVQFYTFALLLYVLLSWVAPPGTYSPATALLDSLCEPLLRPVRRLIPPLGGIDFSAAFVIIALWALYIAINEYLLAPGY